MTSNPTPQPTPETAEEAIQLRQSVTHQGCVEFGFNGDMRCPSCKKIDAVLKAEQEARLAQMDAKQSQPTPERAQPVCQHRSLQLAKVQDDAVTVYVCGRCASKFQVEPMTEPTPARREEMFQKHSVPWGQRSRQA